MPFDPTKVKIGLVETIDQISEFWAWLTSGHRIIGFDIETDGLDWVGGKIRLAQFGSLTEGWAIPYELYPGIVTQALNYLKDRRIPIVGHNVGGFDLTWARKHCNGFQPHWELVHDTQTAVALLDSAGPKGLKDNAVAYVHPIAKFGQQALHDDMKRGGWTWGTVPYNLPSYYIYGVLDTILTVNLFMEVMPLIQKIGLMDAYRVEMHTEKVLHMVSYNGLRVDVEHCNAQLDALHARNHEIQEQVRSEYGIDNIGSGPQLAQAFVNTGVVLTQRTPSGKAWSMSADSLEIIAVENNDHPLVRLVTEYRRGVKYSGYFNQNIEFCRADGKAHPAYRQMQARTLRMSAQYPPIQTQPRAEDPREGEVQLVIKQAEVRNSFVADPDTSFISADFSNVEARLFALLANDPGMIQAFKDGVDLHCWTGGQMYEGGKILEKSDPRRQKSKNSLFTALFGGGASKLAVTAGIPIHEADATIKLLKQTFGSIGRYNKQIQHEANIMEAATGRSGVRLRDGRIVRLQKEDDRFYAYVNYSIQGSARMVLAERLRALDYAGLAQYGVAIIHDEVVFQIPDEFDHEEVRRDIGTHMSDYETYEIPIIAAVGHPSKRLGQADH